MSQKIRTYVKYILIGAGAVSGVSMIISMSLYQKTIRRRKNRSDVNKKANRRTGKSEAALKVLEDGQKWFEAHCTKEIDIESYDHLMLHGYYFEASGESNITVIRFHGYGSDARKSTLANQMFREQFNANIIAPDLRGHGKSEGEYVGFGWHDRLDILKWIEYVIETKGNDHKIVLFGGSMGGAAVMMASGETLPDNVKLIIEDCGYSSVEKILKYQIKNAYHLPKNPFLPIADMITRLHAGYGFDEASAIRQVAKATVPMLFIHGGKDVFVPTDMVYEVYEACNTDKDLLIVEEAGHNESFVVDPLRYTQFIKPYMTKYVCR